MYETITTMAMNTQERGRCACGMQGEIAPHDGATGNTRKREMTITSENGIRHESTWEWKDGTGQRAGAKGTCRA